MEKSERIKIGILGGIGRNAARQFDALIDELTIGIPEQQQPITIIINDPRIPDRTSFIQGQGEDPVPYILNGLKCLHEIGCHFAVIVCNTAHSPIIFDRILSLSPIPLLNIIQETIDYIKNTKLKNTKIGLIATSGTIDTKIYTNYLLNNGFTVIFPDGEHQKYVMNAIFGENYDTPNNKKNNGIKNGFIDKPQEYLNLVYKHLIEQDVELFLDGCTEIPLVKYGNEKHERINPMRIVANSCIDIYFNKRQLPLNKTKNNKNESEQKQNEDDYSNNF